jgi:putative hemolysin
LLKWTGVVWLVEGVTRSLRRLTGETESPEAISQPRRVITQLMREGLGHGVISPYQSNMIDRALELGQLTVQEVMRPWRSAAAVRTTDTAEAVWALADRVPYSRFPLMDPAGQPIGLVEVNTVLQHDPRTCPPLQMLARPVAKVPRYLSLPEALQTLQRTGSSMAVVLDHRRPVGLVTVKDLIEPLVGELGAL